MIKMPGGGQMAKPGGFDQVVDDVVRLQEYEEAHPAVDIEHHEDPPPWHWTASWDEDGARIQITDHTLGGLLHQLDSLELS
jgi:hypothetical protein